MAVTGTNKWTQIGPNTSVQNRDFFSGDITVDNAAYNDAKTFEFGFSATSVHIHNTGSNDLVIQWFSRKGQSVDNDVIPGSSSVPRVYDLVNKTGVLLRHNGSATTARVVAFG